MYIIGKHFSCRFQQNLNESYTMTGSKVRMTNVHSLILTIEYNNIVIKIFKKYYKLN